VNENAFVAEAQTRPCPTFGRPVHHGFPLDYGPVFLLMPFGSHLTVDTLPSEVLPAVALALCFLRPARNYPRFWIWRPSFGCQRDLNPPGRRVAQHALRVLGVRLLQMGMSGSASFQSVRRLEILQQPSVILEHLLAERQMQAVRRGHGKEKKLVSPLIQ